MADNNSFSISRKGYNCAEVDEYISYASQSETQLRESYASLQEKHDALHEENSKLRKDCTALALALQKLRETAVAEDNTDGNEGLREEIAALRAEKEALTAELAAAREKDGEASDCYSDAASKMIAEVAQIVQKLEKDAQRKADAITAAARLEQEKAKLIKEQVNHEVRSLMSMLVSFADDADEETIVEIIGEEETE